MKFSILALLFSLLMFSSCSEHIPSKNEQAYLDTVDSLRLYQSAPYLQRELAGNEKARDLLKLEYADFKEKHDWNNEEIEVFVDIIQGHINIAKLTDSYNLNDD
ncbi:MAG: hypothetical protein AB8B56_00785 [Crocinitomicaceae bacterium]